MNPNITTLRQRVLLLLSVFVILCLLLPALPNVGEASAQGTKPTPTPVVIGAPVKPGNEAMPGLHQPEGAYPPNMMAIPSSSNVNLIGQIGGGPNAVAMAVVSGTPYAFVGAGYRLTILDMSTPILPAYTGSLGTFLSEVQDIAVGSIQGQSGKTFAFVAAGSNGLHIIDVSTPGTPVEVGSYDTAGTAQGVAVADISGTTFAFIADGNGGVESFKVTTPSAPVLVDAAATTNAVSVALATISGTTYAFAADPGDASNPLKRWTVSTTAGHFTSPFHSGLISLVPSDLAVASVSGTAYVFVAAGGTFEIYTSDWTSTASATDPNDASSVAVATFSGITDAYITDGTTGQVLLYNVSTPASPVLDATIPASAPSGRDYVSVAAATISSVPYAFVADANYGMRMINDNTNTEDKLYNLPLAVAVDVSGSYAYTVAGAYGFNAINIFNPAAPVPAGFYQTDGIANDVVKTEISSTDYAFVADGKTSMGTNSGTRILDIHNLSSISEPSTGLIYSNGGEAQGVDVATISDKSYVFTANSLFVTIFKGLRIANVSDPTNPNETGMTPAATSADARRVVISGNYAYVAARSAGLAIIDITDPTTPGTTVHYYDTDGDAMSVAVSGNYAFVADDSGGLVAVNISDKDDPQWAGTLSTSWNAKDVVVNNNIAYVAADAGGLRVIDVTAPASMSQIGFYDTPGNALGVDTDGTYIYLADNTGGLDIFQYNGNTYSISGTVRDASSNPVSGVVVSTGTGATATTNASGLYSLTGLLPGTYTLTASKSTYNITNSWGSTVTITNVDLVGKNFTATPLSGSYKISGYVRNSPSDILASVLVTDGGSRSTTTNASGYFELTSLPAGSYTLSGYKTGFTITASGWSNPVTISTADVADRNFTYSSTPGPYTVTGRVSDGVNGLASVTVASSSSGSATSGNDGNYILTGVSAGGFTLTASIPGYTCSPAILSGSAPSDVTGKNFTCIPGGNGPYTISGRVADASNLPISGVTLLLSNGLTAMTDGSGNYVISGVSLGSYTLMPSRSGYTFSPVTRTITVSSNQTNQTFTGSVVGAGSYTVAGKITSNGTLGISGIIIYASNGLTATTDSSGNYTLNGFATGTYAVMPVNTSYLFTPASASVGLSSGTPSITQNFIGSGATPYSISGHIADGSSNPIPGVTILLNNGLNTVTNASGDYVIGGLTSGNYTLLAFKTGYTFTPPTQTVSVSSEVNVDTIASFIAVLAPSGSYTVSGRVTDGTNGVAGVSIYAGNGLVVVSDASGNYTLSGFSAGTFGIMPVSSGYSFVPVSRSVIPSSLTPNISGQDFVRSGAPSGPYSITGRVTETSSGNPIQGTLISDGAGHTTFSDVNGNFTLSGLAAGSYNLSAALSGYTFTSSFTNPVVITAANVTDKNFAGRPGTGGSYSISGRITDSTNPIAGVTVSDGTHSAVTDSSGYYTISNVPYGTYVVTPSKDGYSFSPASLTTSVPPNASGIDFHASVQPTYTISGRITDTSGDPLANVTLTDGAGRTTATDGNGNYVLNGISAGVYTLTPSKNGYTFMPVTQVGSAPPNAIDRNFTAMPAATFTVSGRVVDNNGDPMAEVSVSDAGGRISVTDSNGNYTLNGVPKGTYTLTAFKNGYIFSPNPLIGSVPPNATKQNFTGMKGIPTPLPSPTPSVSPLPGPTNTPAGPTATPGGPTSTPVPSTSVISGTVRDSGGNLMPGVTISDGQGHTANTDNYGNYLISGYLAGSYNMTALKTGYSCSPYPQLVSVPPNALANFTCSLVYYAISGAVTDANKKAISGVSISAGTGTTPVVSDSSGAFTFSLPMGSYTLTPSKTAYVFAPTSYTVNLTSNLSGLIIYGATGITDVIINGNMETDKGWYLPYNKAGYSTQEYGDLWAETQGIPTATPPPDKDYEVLMQSMTAAYTTDEIHSGTRSLRVGIVDPTKNVAGYSEARQRIQVPWTTKIAKLRFWLYPTGGTPDNKDIQIVSILDFYTKQKERLLTLHSNVGQWQYYEYDLTKYLGQTIWIYYGVYNDGLGSVSGMYVDDVSLPCAAGDTPPLPPITPTQPQPGPLPTVTPLPPTGSSISGRVISSSAAPYSGVTVSTSDGHSTVTNANGDYVLGSLTSGVYLVTPSLAGATFIPPSASVTLSSSIPNVTGINFTGSGFTPPSSLTISGLVKDSSDVPLPNVTVTDGMGHTASSNASGQYTLSALSSGTYLIAAAAAGYNFTPVSRSVTITSSASNQDFTGSAVSGGSYTVSGKILDGTGVAIAGITVSAGGSFSASTNSTGDYVISGLTAGSYIISPSKSSYTFSPVSRVVSLSGLNNAADVNFTGSSGSFPPNSISGKVTLGSIGMEGVSISDGAGGHTATTNSSGEYILSGLYAGDYTISASKAAYLFTPNFSNPVTVASTAVTGKDFTAASAPTQRTNNDAMQAYYIPAASKPKIDGDFPSSTSDFPSSLQWSTNKKEISYPIIGHNIMHDQDIYGVYDIKADALFGWDEQYLYVFTKVYDDIYVQAADDYRYLYKGDGVDLALDTQVADDYTSKLLSADDFRIGMSGATHSPSNNNPKMYVYSPFEKAGIPNWVTVAARSFCEVLSPYQCYAIDKYIDYTGYTFEAAIKWSSLGVTPSAGNHYGFAFSVNDNDQVSKLLQEKGLSSVNDPNVFFDPTTWADLELMP